MGAGTTINVKVTDGALAPAVGTTAAVLNLTVVGPSGVGFWSASPHGSPRPLAASLYVDERASLLGVGLAMPNLVTVPVGPDGTIDIFSQSGGHVVVDMLGAYVESAATAGGRLQTLPAPERILDTRNFLTIQPRTTLPVTVPNANGASAAVLTVTTIAQNPGYWTFFPTSTTTPPLAANLNSLFPLHIAANQVIVPLDATGNFNVFSQSGGHLIVDLVGFITGPTAAVSTDGLFVPLDTPTRFLDTRNAPTNPIGGTQMAAPRLELRGAGDGQPRRRPLRCRGCRAERHRHRPALARLRHADAGWLERPGVQGPQHRDGERRARRADAAEPRDRRRLARAASTSSRSTART